ncbi:10318_t:CDS:2 [Funneliformis geosporum]|nr:10318_t:CDS:2 [Funneliformis geosporum]
MKVSKKNGSKVAINSRIKAISSKRLISEIKQRLDDNIISRREVLELAGIGYCLDCSKDEELKEVIIHGYNFSDFRAKEKDYLMTIEYQGKKFSETFRTETKGYFIFTDLEDKFRAVKKIVEQIITDFKLSRVENTTRLYYKWKHTFYFCDRHSVKVDKMIDPDNIEPITINEAILLRN